jgi:hypothetical protein
LNACAPGKAHFFLFFFFFPLLSLLVSIETIISHLSHVMSLAPGDIILTGTPAGVGPLIPGDVITSDLVDADGKVVVGTEFAVEGKEVQVPLI